VKGEDIELLSRADLSRSMSRLQCAETSPGSPLPLSRSAEPLLSAPGWSVEGEGHTLHSSEEETGMRRPPLR
jgi:hypothetical protein